MMKYILHTLQGNPRITIFICAFACMVLIVVTTLTQFVFVAPWQASGSLSLFAYAVPEEGVLLEKLGMSVYDITLLRGERAPITLPNAPHTLLSTPPDMNLLAHAKVLAGEYSGIRFSIRNLEVRNDWRGDGAPEQLSLLHDSITFPTPFTIQEDTTSIILAGFETNRAIRMRDNKRTYLPTIALEIRERAPLQEDDSARLPHGGVSVQNATFGMTWEGIMKRNFRAEEYELSHNSNAVNNEPTPIPTTDTTLEEPELTDEVTSTTTTETEVVSTSTDEV